MKNNQWFKVFFFFGKRTIVLYLLAFVMANVLFDIPKVTQTVRLKILNRFRPETFDYLVETVNRGNTFDKKRLEPYAFYYQKVTEYIPKRADAYGMLGFCYYHMGERQKAIESYEKAIEIHDQFFWFYYNLGMIYFKEGEYKQAYEWWKKAAHTKPQAAFGFIQWSQRIYMPLVGIHRRLGYSVEEELRMGYKDCYMLLAMLQQYFFNRPEFKDVFLKMGSHLHIF